MFFSYINLKEFSDQYLYKVLFRYLIQMAAMLLCIK